MIEIMFATIVTNLAAAAVMATVNASASSEEIPKMSKEEARPLLERSEITVIDVRQPHHLEASDSKIPGAIREDPQKISSWADKYPKDKALLLY